MPSTAPVPRGRTRSSPSRAFVVFRRVLSTNANTAHSKRPITPFSCGVSTTCWRAEANPVSKTEGDHPQCGLPGS